MLLDSVDTNRLGMSVIPGITRITPPSAGGGLAGMGDLTYSLNDGAPTTLTNTQLLMIAVVAYLILKR